MCEELQHWHSTTFIHWIYVPRKKASFALSDAYRHCKVKPKVGFELVFADILEGDNGLSLLHLTANRPPHHGGYLKRLGHDACR